MPLSNRLNLSRIKRLAAEGGWLLAGQMAAVAAALVLVRVLTESLSPAQYGELALGLTVASLINQVAMGGITNGVSRYYSIAAEAQDLRRFFVSAQHLLFYASLVVLVVGVIVVGGLVLTSQEHWVALASVALVFSVFSGYNAALSGVQNAARQRAVVALHSAADAWLKIGITVCLLPLAGTTSTVVIAAYACSSLLITVSQSVFVRRALVALDVNAPVASDWTRKIWEYSLPFSAFGVFTWMQLVSDRWALQKYATLEDVGQYAVLFQLGYAPIAIVTGLAAGLVAPILYQHSGDATDPQRNAHVHRMAWQLAFISLVGTLIGFGLLYFAHTWVYALLVATPYRNNSYLLPWVVLAGGLFATGQILALKLMTDMRPKTMSVVKIATAVVGIVCNLVGAIFFGLKGVVAALVVFSLLYCLCMVVIARSPRTT